MKKILLSFLILFPLLLSSCGAARQTGGEPLPADGAEARTMCAIILPLFRGASLDPVVFSDYSSGREQIHNALLADLLAADYPLYTSAGEAYLRAKEAHPSAAFFNLIPQEALESRLYALFGVVSFAHSDTADFRYYPDLSAYSAEFQPPPGERKITVYSCEKTDGGAILLFRAFDLEGKESGGKYYAFFSEDGERYRLLSIRPANGKEGSP